MNIWLVGGDHVIPTSVEKAIQGDGYTVKRISGEDRYETAAMVAEAGISLSGKKPSKVFVASGTSFADALAVSPVAFAKGYPIILTEKDSTSDFSKKELGNIGTDAKILVGGEAVVSKAVAANLSIKEDARVAGADRAVTANLVSDWAKKSEGFNPANAALVGGTNGNGADSLVAASLGGKSLTTLHFAGWDATSTYFKDHSSELTGKGFVFGGKAAVSGDQVDKAQGAAQTVAAGVSYIVTDVTAKASGKFAYADAAAKAETAVTLADSDKYMVSGVAATQGAFVAALTKGDVVSVSGTKGAMTYSLTNKTAADYAKGMVVAVDTSAHTLSIGEPVVGASLNDVTDYTAGTPGTYTVFTVDGATVSQTIFESSIQLGDMVEITGTGADATHIRTIALTNASVNGTVSVAGGTTPHKVITVKTAAGASLGTFTTTATDKFTLDGVTSTEVANFDAASVGDTITVSRSGGVQTFALVNSAPSSVSGVVAASTSTDLNWWKSAGKAGSVSYASLTDATYSIDGKIASDVEFKAAVTAGDLVTYQAADAATKTTASLALTSKPLVGKVSATDASAHTISVATADDDELVAGLDYSNKSGFFSTGTSLVYTVNGETKSLSQFDTSIKQITSGALQGTVQVSIANGVVTYALATTAWTAAPAITKVAYDHTGTSVIVTFNKPVTELTGAAAADWAVKVGATTRTPSVSAWNSPTELELTITMTGAAGDAVIVAPVSTDKAALYVDAYGTSVGSASFTGKAV